MCISHTNESSRGPRQHFAPAHFTRTLQNVMYASRLWETSAPGLQECSDWRPNRASENLWSSRSEKHFTFLTNSGRWKRMKAGYGPEPALRACMEQGPKFVIETARHDRIVCNTVGLWDVSHTSFDVQKDDSYTRLRPYTVVEQSSRSLTRTAL